MVMIVSMFVVMVMVVIVMMMFMFRKVVMMEIVDSEFTGLAAAACFAHIN